MKGTPSTTLLLLIKPMR